MRLARLAHVVALLACSTGATVAVAQGPYRVLDTWKVGGTGGWDYLLADPSAHKLYVTHNNRVEVLDTLSGKVVGAITGFKGTHGIALDPDGRTGYISDGGANAVVVFDRNSYATLASIPAGTNPDGIAFEPVTRTVWAFNGRSKNVSVIDAASRTVVATIALPGKPEFPQADGAGNVFANIEDKNSVVKLDAKTRTLVSTWQLPGCESPSGLAYDPAHARLFSVCDGGKMAVLNAHTGAVLALPSIGDGPDAAAYDAKDQLAFSSNGQGTLSVVDAAHGYKTIQTLPTARGARTMAFDAGNGRIYLAAAEQGPAPAATAATPHPRPAILPDTFKVIVVGR